MTGEFQPDIRSFTIDGRFAVVWGRQDRLERLDDNGADTPREQFGDIGFVRQRWVHGDPVFEVVTPRVTDLLKSDDFNNRFTRFAERFQNYLKDHNAFAASLGPANEALKARVDEVQKAKMFSQAFEIAGTYDRREWVNDTYNLSVSVAEDRGWCGSEHGEVTGGNYIELEIVLKTRDAWRRQKKDWESGSWKMHIGDRGGIIRITFKPDNRVVRTGKCIVSEGDEFGIDHPGRTDFGIVPFGILGGTDPDDAISRSGATYYYKLKDILNEVLAGGSGEPTLTDNQRDLLTLVRDNLNRVAQDLPQKTFAEISER